MSRACSCRRRKRRLALRTTFAAMGEAGEKDQGDFRGRCDHRHGHHAARHRRVGARYRHRRIAESVHDSAGDCVSVGQPEGLGVDGYRQAAALLLQSQERTEERGQRRIELDAGDFTDAGAGRSVEVHQDDRHGEAGGKRPAAGAGDAGGMRGAGPRIVSRRQSGGFGDRRDAACRHGFRRHRQGIQVALRVDHRQRARDR